MKCDYCDKKVKAFNLKYLTRAMNRHLRKCKEKSSQLKKLNGGNEKMEEGEEYFVLLIGDLKIPFFPAKSKAGKLFYQARLQLWKNKKGSKKDQEEEPGMQPVDAPIKKVD